MALDIHKTYLVAGTINNQQEVVLPPRRVSSLESEGWAKKQSRSDDAEVQAVRVH
jgi:hypothetical protein